MSEYTWEDVETIIDQVLDLPKKDRRDFIKQECGNNKKLKGEVTQLLESILDSEGWLENPTQYKQNFYEEIARDVDRIDAQETLIGRNVGAYIIKDKVGEGGMGSVYRAERSDGFFDHQVAIKVIRSGQATPENVRRFERERSILAGLNHPGIAQLFDGGITEQGTPYLIMEYIEGIPVDEYCKQNNLTLHQKVELFKKVLQAVQHAHENLVIHRDLKPGNILVTGDEQIKILDFGISKLVEDSDSDNLPNTLTQTRVLTPKYAAPEQVREQSISTATDLYALGTIFYELLTGNHPLGLKDQSYYKTQKLILEQHPIPPSNNISNYSSIKGRQLRGDLTAILLKSLSKEPDQRYRTANHFLYDLNHYQQDMPISARPHSIKYRSYKFWGRHKYVITAIASFIALIIIFASIYTSRITKERNNAQLEAQKATQIKNLLSDILQQSSPFAQPNRDITLAKVLDRGSQKIQQSLNDQPQIKAELLGLIGDNYTSLGNFSKGEKLVKQSIDLYKPSQLKSARRTYINNLDRMGRIYYRTGRFEEAESVYLEALELIKREYGTDSNYASSFYGSLASVYREKGNLLKTEAFYGKALTLADSTQKANIAVALDNLAIAYRDQRMFKKAISLHKQSLKLQLQMHANLHPNVASAYNNLAFTYQQSGNFPKADSLHQIALSMRRKLFPPDHHHIASSVIRLGLLKIKQMHTQEAEKLLKEGYDILRKKLPADHWQVISAKGGLAVSRAMQGEFAENVPIVVDAYESFVKKFGADDWRSHEAAKALSNLYRIWGKPQKAQMYADKIGY